MASPRHGPDEDLTSAFATEAEPAAADIEQARAAGLDDLDVRAVADAKFRQTADPSGFAGDGVDFAPFARPEQFQWQQRDQSSLTLLAELLRFSLIKCN
jgi:hypothetical protein